MNEIEKLPIIPDFDEIEFPFVDDHDWVWFDREKIVYRWTETKWHNFTKQQYLDAGYIYTNVGDLFRVDVRDLSYGSNVEVVVYCVVCKKIRTAKFRDINHAGHSKSKGCAQVPNLIGQIFHYWKVLDYGYINKYGSIFWLCECTNCGTVKHVSGSSLLNESSKSCGCYQREVVSAICGEKHHQWKGGGVTYYGPNWYSQRQKARDRDGNCCRRCGKTKVENGKELDVHHITPFRTFMYVSGENDYYIEANDLDNLVTVCRACHPIVEQNYYALFDFYDLKS